MGTGHDYKSSWAPIKGMRQRFNIAPVHIHYAQRALDLADRMRRRLFSLMIAVTFAIGQIALDGSDPIDILL